MYLVESSSCHSYAPMVSSNTPLPYPLIPQDCESLFIISCFPLTKLVLCSWQPGYVCGPTLSHPEGAMIVEDALVKDLRPEPSLHG